MRRFVMSVWGSVVILTATGAASAANINLSGNLGVNNWHTASTPLGVGNALPTLSFFQSVPGVGDLSGDVNADNTGVNGLGNSLFSLTVTNVTFQAYGATPATQTYVKLVIAQNFSVSTPGTHAAKQSVDGVMSATGGCVVIGNTEIGAPIGSPSGTLLPSVSFGGGSSGAVDMFNVGPTLGTYSSALTTVLVEMQLELTINGTGFVNMPTSFSSVVENTPAPGAAGVMAMAGMLGLRRRR